MPPDGIRAHLTRFADAARRGIGQSDHIHLVLTAVFIGFAGGLLAVGFRFLIELVNWTAWRESTYSLAYIRSLPAWWKLAAPIAGGGVVGFIVHRFAREAKGHGVPEVMEAVALRGGRIRPRVVIAKMFASAVSIGSGGSVGREGPIVQIGSALGSAVGQWLRVDESRLRTLVGCGAAAGIAATFNAPIAGALFAAEVILGNFGVAQFSPIVISSVAATVVSRHFLGDFPAFVVPTYSLVHPLELLAYAALGLLAGLVALGFIKVLYGTEDLFDRFPLPAIPRAMLGGALVGAIGLFAPQVFGVGYEAINEALNGTMLWQIMVALIALKILAVAVTIGSGGSGGIFAPSLFVGAMLGGGIGMVVHALWPTATGTTGAYALVGMGAVVAATTHAPITAILIIFELTADYQIILPLMISSIIATLLATRLLSSSIYTLKLLRRGVDVRGGRALNVLAGVPVAEAVRTNVVTMAPETNLTTVLARFVAHPDHTIFVVDEDDGLCGIIQPQTMRAAMADATSLGAFVIAQDLMTDMTAAHLTPQDALADAMRLMAGDGTEIPVLDGDRFVGVVLPRDVLARYNTELFKRDMVESVTSTMRVANRSAPIPMVGDVQITELPAPSAFCGQTIGQLDIRRQYGLTVLVVRHEDGTVTASPTADYCLRLNDVLVVLGEGDALARIRREGPA